MKRSTVQSPSQKNWTYTRSKFQSLMHIREVLAAGEILESQWNVAADVWSVTSFTELRRTGLEIERWNRVHPNEPPKVSWVEQCLTPAAGPIIAVTEYVRAVPDLIRTWVPRQYITLGTDGFGRSDTRAALRRYFEVDRSSIAFCALHYLAQAGILNKSVLSEFNSRNDYCPGLFAPIGA